MKFSYITLLIIIFFQNGFSQNTFEKIFGNVGNYNYAVSVIQNADTGFMVLGSYNIGVPGHYPCIIKINSSGDSLWQRNYCAALPMKIIQSFDDNYIFVGSSVCPVTDEIAFIKVNNIGDTIWTQHYGFGGLENGMGITETRDSGYVIIADVGGTYPTLFKVDSLGNYIWGHNVVMAIPYSIKQTLDGGFIVAGWTGTTAGWAIEKYDSTGAGQWGRYYGNSSPANIDERFHDVIQLADSDFIAAGAYPLSLVKINHINGDTIWTRNFGTDINSIAYTYDHNIIAVDASAHIIKYDTSGAQLWSRYFPNAFLRSITPTSDGGYIGCGAYSTNGITSSVVVIKTDSLGNVSSLISVDENNISQNNSNVFPNPVKNTSQLNFFNPKNETISFSITDITGRVSEEKEITGSSVEIAKGNKPEGVYFYTLFNTKTGERLNGKFVVQ